MYINLFNCILNTSCFINWLHFCYLPKCQCSFRIYATFNLCWCATQNVHNIFERTANNFCFCLLSANVHGYLLFVILCRFSIANNKLKAKKNPSKHASYAITSTQMKYPRNLGSNSKIVDAAERSENNDSDNTQRIHNNQLPDNFKMEIKKNHL